MAYYLNPNDFECINIFNDTGKPCYFCVIHDRCVSAFYNGFDDSSVQEHVIVFCGKVNNGLLKLNDCENGFKISITHSEIVIEYQNRNIETLEYAKDFVCKWIVPICDAMESWRFIVSEEEIDCEYLFKNYRKDEKGIYYNLEEEKTKRKSVKKVTELFKY